MNPATETPRHTLSIGLLLLVLLLATRYHHFGSMLHLPDASWAIFFAVGFYLRRSLWLGVFLGAAALIDYYSITQGGSSAYCISPAYGFLLPAYAALWWGGRIYSRYHSASLATLLPLAITAVVATTVCFLISNGAFYWLSGRFEETTIAEYASRVTRYYPMFLKTTLGYVAAFATAHTAVLWLKDSRPTPDSSGQTR